MARKSPPGGNRPPQSEQVKTSMERQPPRFQSSQPVRGQFQSSRPVSGRGGTGGNRPPQSEQARTSVERRNLPSRGGLQGMAQRRLNRGR